MRFGDGPLKAMSLLGTIQLRSPFSTYPVKAYKHRHVKIFDFWHLSSVVSSNADKDTAKHLGR